MSVPNNNMQAPKPFDIKKECGFIQACASGDLKKVRWGICYKPHLVNAPIKSIGSFPLILAAKAGHLNIVSALIKAGAKLNASPTFGPDQDTTALLLATLNQHWKVMWHLLEKGADPNASPKSGPYQGYTALFFAAAHKKWELVWHLLNKGADPKISPISGQHQGLTILLMAAADKQWELVWELLRRGVDPNITSASGLYEWRTVLLFAAEDQQWDLVQKLLNKGADLNATPKSGPYQGYTALFFAAAHQKWDLVQKLLNKGADPNASPASGVNQGKTALWIAAFHGADDTIKQLLFFGAFLDSTPKPLEEMSFSLKGPNESTKKLLAAANALFDLAEKPIKNFQEFLTSINNAVTTLGVGLNGKRNGKTAVHLAIEKGNVRLAQQLAMFGADLTGAPECKNVIVSLLAGLQELEKLAFQLEKESNDLSEKPTIKRAQKIKGEKNKENQDAADQKKSGLSLKQAFHERVKRAVYLRFNTRELIKTLDSSFQIIIEDVQNRLNALESKINKAETLAEEAELLLNLWGDALPTLELDAQQMDDQQAKRSRFLDEEMDILTSELFSPLATLSPKSTKPFTDTEVSPSTSTSTSSSSMQSSGSTLSSNSTSSVSTADSVFTPMRTAQQTSSSRAASDNSGTLAPRNPRKRKGK